MEILKFWMVDGSLVVYLDKEAAWFEAGRTNRGVWEYTAEITDKFQCLKVTA